MAGQGPPEQLEATARALEEIGLRAVHRCVSPLALLELYPWLTFGHARTAWPSEIVPGFLFLGTRDFASSAARLRAVGLTHVLSLLTEEEADMSGPVEAALEHHLVFLDDADDADLVGALPQCFAFLDGAAGAGRVLVHCNRGRSRSAAVVAAYVMKDRGVSLERAVSFVASHRPCVLINPGFTRQLRILETAICFERLPDQSRSATQGILEKLLRAAAAGDPRPVRLENPKLAAAIAEAPVVLSLLGACGFMTVQDPTRGSMLQPTDRSFERHLCAQMLARLRPDAQEDAREDAGSFSKPP